MNTQNLSEELPKLPTATVYTFRNIQPVNSIKEALERGGFFGDTRAYDPFFVGGMITFPPCTRPKDVSLLCLNWTTEELDVIPRLREHGKRPCDNAPNYFLGLMAAFSETRMPPQFKGKDIVAMGTSALSVFRYKNGAPCNISACRSGTGRVLNFVRAHGTFGPNWALVVEDL
ncbi:MAG: hypothetical protein V4697_03060 [Patescibacteria group bacterium]